MNNPEQGDSLDLLQDEMDELIEKMQTPEAKRAARSLFSATMEELGQSASKAREEELGRVLSHVVVDEP